MQYSALTELRDQLKECLDPCEYKFFVSLGEPPADCNSIAIWIENSRRSRSNDECSTRFLESNVNITITRCCVTADARLTFNHVQEGKDAECFHNDMELLLACITCNTTLDNDSISCGAVIDSIRYDRFKSGGCYSATITLGLTEEICCIDE